MLGDTYLVPLTPESVPLPGLQIPGQEQNFLVKGKGSRLDASILAYNYILQFLPIMLICSHLKTKQQLYIGKVQIH